MKTLIQVDSQSLDHISALCALAKLFEYDYRATHNPDEEVPPDFFKEEEFWGRHLPSAIKVIIGAIEYLITSYELSQEDIRGLFGYSDEWKYLPEFAIKELTELIRFRDQLGRGSND